MKRLHQQAENLCDRTLPFDGALGVTEIDAIPVPQGLSFPKSSWRPDLRAQLVLSEFCTTNWRQFNESETVPGEKWQHVDGFTLAPPSLDFPDNLEAELALLMERAQFQRNGARMAEIAHQADHSMEYWQTLLSITPASKPATMTLMTAGFTIGQMVGMYFKDFFHRARPSHYLPTLMTVLPTPAHPAFPSNHALQNELVGLLALRCLPDSLSACYVDAISSLAHRIGENREIAGVHFVQDSDAGRQVARWLDREFMGKLDIVQSLVAEARDEWHVSGKVTLRCLPFVAPFDHRSTEISAQQRAPDSMVVI